MRIELRDGQWADLRERITHGTDKHIKTVIRKGRANDDEFYDIDDELVRAFVREWHVVDDETKQPIPLTDPDAIDRAPPDIIDLLSNEASAAWSGATQPDRVYSLLIGRLLVGQAVSESEIEKLPEPDLMRDAWLLASRGQFTPSELDSMDALLLAVTRRLMNGKVQSG